MALDGDHQFELDGFTFGGKHAVILDGEDGFDPGSAGWRTQDQSQPTGDGGTFGRDYLDGPTWNWKLGTHAADEASALATLAAFMKVWRADSVRGIPGAVLALRYRVAGRTRRVYGRPRRLTHAPTNRILGGWLPITCDFTCADALHYDDVESVASLAVAPGNYQGLTIPLEEPLSTTTTGAESTSDITVGGDAPTWAVVTFTGPVLNPYVVVGDWHCGVRGNIAEGDSVTVDSRPWARTAVDGNGAGVGGRLDRLTFMDRMQLEPGTHEMAYGGGADVATSTVTVRWRSASYAL